ncbi:hypothetical protein Tco_0596348 [Tanacetum coccineum]
MIGTIPGLKEVLISVRQLVEYEERLPHRLQTHNVTLTKGEVEVLPASLGLRVKLIIMGMVVLPKRERLEKVAMLRRKIVVLKLQRLLRLRAEKCDQPPSGRFDEVVKAYIHIGKMIKVEYGSHT